MGINSALTSTSSIVNSSRWPSSNSSTAKIISKQPYTFNKEFYEPSSSSSAGLSSNYAGTTTNATFDDNPIPTSTTVSAIDGVLSSSGSSTRRPNKYTKSNYLSAQQSGSGGSKTEKIVSKSSKSSPNLLLAKDFDHYYTDRYNNTTTASANNNTTPNTNQYHSSVNPYLSVNYGNYSSSSYYQPQSSSSMNADHYSGYNQTNSSREDKWNELDSMLGAQSALLSRLESDFVANRKKSQPSAFSHSNGLTSTAAYNPITHTNRYSSGSSQLVSKLPSTINSDIDILTSSASYLPSRYNINI